ncbi:MAG: hypothetical protein KKC23_02320, partial [Proteobacteria bacterium]|nr:hypothetical protein [Pseudomonadota bacterium]
MATNSERMSPTLSINFLNEFYCFPPNLALLNEQLREIALNDIWFYKSHQEANRALKIIVNFFKDFLNKGLDYPNKERALKTLLEFVQLLYENQNAEIDFSSLITEACIIISLSSFKVFSKILIASVMR